MNLNFDNPIMERKTKTVYKDGDKTIKLFVENYSKADILNEALNQSRVEEGTDLNIPKLLEVSKVENRWALVSEHIEGTPLDKLMEQNPEKTDEYMNMFIDIQLNILNKSKKEIIINKNLPQNFKDILTEKNINFIKTYQLF